MFDLLNLTPVPADPKAELGFNPKDINSKDFGFEKFYFLDSIKDKSKLVKSVNVIDAGAKFKNKKVLIVLDDYAFDEGAIKLIAEKKQACFLIDIGRIVNSSGVSRAILFSKLRTFLKMCNRYGAFYAFATFSNNKAKIRTSDELIHIAMLFGMNKGQARFALRMMKNYLL
ncbi:hypothetical protein HY988_05985 [Candidatus Micrarchaeota archaeon]|nr:hypothetical protein [Candidatus Micrarchaeota archaeon]